MLLRRLLQFNVFVSGFFGIAFVFAPTLVLSIYGVGINGSIIFLGQLYGCMQLSFAVVIWKAINITHSDLKRWLVYGLFIGDTIAALVSAWAQMNGAMNTSGWLVVILYSLFAIGYGYSTMTYIFRST